MNKSDNVIFKTGEPINKDLDLFSKTIHGVGMSKAKEHLRRNPTLWDQVAKEKHDQDLAIELRNSAIR